MNKTKLKKILAAVAFVLIICVVFSGCSMLGMGTDTQAAEGEGGLMGMLTQLVLPIVLMVGVFYFFMIRPEKKRKKEAEDLRNSISAGDPVVTIGGITGKVVSVSGDSIVFETGDDRVRVEVKKWAISKKEK